MADYTIEGTIRTGIRAVFLNDNGGIAEILPNPLPRKNIIDYVQSFNYKRLVYASTSRFSLMGQKIVAFSGARKFFYFLTPDTGLYIFASLYSKDVNLGRDFFNAYVDIAKDYEKWGYFPKILGKRKVSIDCQVEKLHRSPSETFHLKLEADAILLRRMHPPMYEFSIANKTHMKVLHRVRGNKRVTPFALTRKQLKSLYGKDFVAENPKFTYSGYAKFCHLVKRCYLQNKVHQGLRNNKKGRIRRLDIKYGNVVYCTERKRWYYVDFE